jgi:NitT/TauT family transport system substrate-binding protein
MLFYFKNKFNSVFTHAMAYICSAMLKHLSKSKLKHSLLTLGFFIFLCLIWEYSARSFPHLLFVLPPPSSIFRTLWEMRSRFWFHTAITVKEMCAGFFLALTCAFPLAWTMMRFKASRSLLQPVFIVIQCVPMFTLAPIMVVWFGWGYTAIIFPTALMIFFPLTLNIYQGLRSTPVDLLEFFQANQATSWQTFFKLQLPWSLPHIFAGFRISSAIAGVSAVAGEWAGAQNGLGVLMLESRRNTDLEITFGALFCLTFISTILYIFILYMEKIFLSPRSWKMILKNPVVIKVRKKAFALPFLIFATLMLLTTACQQKEQKKIRLLLDWLPNPNHVPIYAGLEKGFFSQEGIDLLPQKMHEGGGGISYLVSGKVDLLIKHMPGTFKACGKGAQLKIIAVLIKEPLCGLTYRLDPRIQSPIDLTNKVLGYCIGTPDMNFLNFLLAQGCIHPCEKKNVSVDLVSAMATHSVDFIYGGFWNIEPAQLRSLGLETKTFKIQEFGVPPYYEMIILARTDSKQATPEFAAGFKRALQKSIDFCYTNPAEAFDCFLKHNQDRSPKSIAWQKEAWAMTLPLLAKDQSIDTELIENFVLWQFNHGILAKKLDVQELFIIDDFAQQ